MIPDPPAELVYGPVTRTDFVRYQGASGDMNPIHYDEGVVKAAGFPAPFSVGMFQAGLLATYATNWLGADNVRRFGSRWKEQVWPGDTLTCTGRVVREYQDGQIWFVDLELQCTRQTGGVAVEAWAAFALPNADDGSDT